MVFYSDIPIGRDLYIFLIYQNQHDDSMISDTYVVDYGKQNVFARVCKTIML